MTKLTKKRLGMSHYENSKIRISHLAVRQDWAILEGLGDKFSFKKEPKPLTTFRLFGQFYW